MIWAKVLTSGHPDHVRILGGLRIQFGRVGISVGVDARPSKVPPWAEKAIKAEEKRRDKSGREKSLGLENGRLERG